MIMRFKKFIIYNLSKQKPEKQGKYHLNEVNKIKGLSLTIQ